METITQEEAHSDTSLRWSGKNPIPKIGEFVGIPFHPRVIRGKVTGFFKASSENFTYLGIWVEPMEILESAYGCGWGCNLLSLIETQKFQGLLEFLNKETPCGIYGAEVQPTPEKTQWETLYDFGCQEELCAIAPAIFGGKEWKEDLQILAWCQGQWGPLAYDALAPTLQRIRNTAHMEYIDWAVKKNKELIQKAKARLKA